MCNSNYETIKVTFTHPIQTIDKMFCDTGIDWGIESLKEWIESYVMFRKIYCKVCINCTIYQRLTIRISNISKVTIYITSSHNTFVFIHF